MPALSAVEGPVLSAVEGSIAGAAAVVAVARVAALAGHELAVSWWSPAAYLWQDAATVLVYAAIDLALRRTRRIAWTVYTGFVAYVALGVPVTRVMSTSMTWTMWRAAGGALSDSMWVYVTVANLLWIAAVVAVAVVVPYVASGLSRTAKYVRSGFIRTAKYVGSGFSRTYTGDGPPKGGSHVPIAGGKLCATFMLGALVALGPTSITRVDTRGLDRNAWSALVASALPRAAVDVCNPSAAGTRDWRRGRADRDPGEDLARFRGAAAGRNVMLVGLESTAAQYLGLYGAAEDPMPHLSALARHAVVFDHAYAVYPESIKGLFSILCSKYPPFDRGAERFADIPCASIASRLADRGYHTALFHSGRFAYLGMEAVIRNRGYGVLADAGEIGGDRESSFGVDDTATSARVLRWIDTIPRGERFFVTYLPIAGHHPYESPEPGPFPARDEFGRYRNALHYGDAALAALRRGLEARGLDDETVWIVYGDHGEAFGQHDGNFGHTFQLYEENVRVPLLVAAPGLLTNQVRARRIVSLIDIAPTILDLLDLPADAAYQGTSTLGRAPGMALFFTDYSLALLGLRDGPMKHIHALDSGRTRVFDLERDPGETQDVAAERADEGRWYAQRLLSWMCPF